MDHDFSNFNLFSSDFHKSIIAFISQIFNIKAKEQNFTRFIVSKGIKRKLLSVFLLTYVLIQLILPLRYLFIPEICFGPSKVIDLVGVSC